MKPDRFYVFSNLGLETTRTSRGAAERDVALIKGIAGRRAWLSDVPHVDGPNLKPRKKRRKSK